MHVIFDLVFNDLIFPRALNAFLDFCILNSSGIPYQLGSWRTNLVVLSVADHERVCQLLCAAGQLVRCHSDRRCVESGCYDSRHINSQSVTRRIYVYFRWDQFRFRSCMMLHWSILKREYRTHHESVSNKNDQTCKMYILDNMYSDCMAVLDVWLNYSRITYPDHFCPTDSCGILLHFGRQIAPMVLWSFLREQSRFQGSKQLETWRAPIWV